MRVSITIEALKSLRGKLILLDTNVLIDASKPEARNAFRVFFESLYEAHCYLLTTTAVAIELLGGAKNFQEMRSLKNYLEEICYGVLLHTDERETQTQSLIEPELLLSYGKRARDVSYTDYLLAKTLKKYQKSAVLLSSNHKDFPTTVFEREHVAILHKESNVTAYGIYTFSESRYQTALRKLQT